jgi:hypothetical protein
MSRSITILDAIVQMSFGRSAQRNVIQTGEAERFAQILIEDMELLQMDCLRWKLVARRRSQKHLISAIGENADFVPNEYARFADFDVADVFAAAGSIFDDGRKRAARHSRFAGTLALDVETSGLEVLKSFFEIELVRRGPAKEHSSIITGASSSSV